MHLSWALGVWSRNSARDSRCSSLSTCEEEKPGLKKPSSRRRDALCWSWRNSGKGATAKEGTPTGRDSGTKKWKQERAGSQKGTERTILARCGSAGSQREELRPWQRSWGRRLGIRKGGIKPQETPCFRASTPKSRVYLLYCFMLSPTPLTLRGAVPHHLSWRRS